MSPQLAPGEDRQCPTPTSGPPIQAHPHPSAAADVFGLPLSTNTIAAAHYRLALLRLAHGEAPLVQYAAALRADATFALAHAGMALARYERGEPWATDLAAAGATVTRATRRERQHVELLGVALHGDTARAIALGLEHLDEFPSDLVVARLVACAVGHHTDAPSWAELARALSVIPWAAGWYTRR
jgi:hypothetical protein